MIDLLRRVYSGECGGTAVRWVFGLYTGFLLAASLIPAAEVPEVPILSWDKAQHALAFALYGGLAAAVCGRHAGWAWITLGAGAAVGLASEGLQAFSPGRQVSGYDLAANFVGVAVAVALVHLFMRSRRPAHG